MANNNHYSDEELKQIQKIETEALRVLLQICEKLAVPCYLIGGSALGVIRHGGFIPWDDDIDVGMLRPDYERFLQGAEELLPKGYSLQTPYNGPRNPYFYTKLRVDGTRFVEYCNHRNRVMHQGVYLDIFVFDEVPDDETENIRQFNRCQRLLRLFTWRESEDVSRPPEGISQQLTALARRCLHRALRLTVSKKRLSEKLEKNLTAWNGTGQSAVACINFPKRKCEYVRLEDLLPLLDAAFEGIPVKIPRNYDVYLKTHYGCYMELPPENERYGHRPYEVEL